MKFYNRHHFSLHAVMDYVLLKVYGCVHGCVCLRACVRDVYVCSARQVLFYGVDDEVIYQLCVCFFFFSVFLCLRHFLVQVFCLNCISYFFLFVS